MKKEKMGILDWILVYVLVPGFFCLGMPIFFLALYSRENPSRNAWDDPFVILIIIAMVSMLIGYFIGCTKSDDPKASIDDRVMDGLLYSALALLPGISVGMIIVLLIECW